MSSRVFQSVIVQMKEATDRMIGVIDADANVISCSDTSMIGEKWPEAVIRLNSAPDSIVVVDKKTFKPLVSWSAYFDYAVFAEGDDETARSLCVMAYVALNGAKNAAWLAAEILALSDDTLAEKLAAERTAMAAQIAAKEEKLQAEIAEL